jgi:hypothetical protein
MQTELSAHYIVGPHIPFVLEKEYIMFSLERPIEVFRIRKKWMCIVLIIVTHD